MVQPGACVQSLMQTCVLPRLEARMLLEHVLQRPRAWLLAHDTDVLSDDSATTFQLLVQRRLAGEPMAYLVGMREFMGHPFRVAPGVLIPRPDTELLVETALVHIAACGTCRVLDMGTGSGAIAISIALAAPQATVWALDISDAALGVAKDNAALLGGRVAFLVSDWFAAIPQGTLFDLIVSNPPYIASDDPHLSLGDLRYEPVGALTDGADGLSDIRSLIDGAPRHLSSGGALWIEHGWQQAEVVRVLLTQAGFERVTSCRDLAGIERISGGYL